VSPYATPTDVLPHRPPFLFIDRVLECTDTSIRAVRTFRPDEEFFAGHFPGNPIVPGVLLVESMAQALAYLALRHEGTKAVYLTGIDRARFRKPVLPGHEVEIEVHVDGIRMGLISARGEARVGGAKVADAKLSGFAEK
jgi:3-hydroxyacyl-[acyl-carrier-protein] dehydratase